MSLVVELHVICSVVSALALNVSRKTASDVEPFDAVSCLRIGSEEPSLKATSKEPVTEYAPRYR